MKFIKTALIILIFASFKSIANIDPVSIARDNGLSNCDNLISRTFSYFGDYKDYDNNLETKYSSSPDSRTRTIRYYFNLGFNRDDFVIGDIVIVSAPNYCASYTNMSFVEENSSCESIKGSENWNENLSRSGFHWLSSGGVNALYIDYNNNRGCKVNFFMSDVDYNN